MSANTRYSEDILLSNLINHHRPRMIASSIAKPFEALWTHLNEKQNALQKLAMQKELQEAEIKCKQKELDTSCVLYRHLCKNCIKQGLNSEQDGAFECKTQAKNRRQLWPNRDPT